MPIRITEINAKNIGPIRELSMRPADFNLVYGRNEQGKTGLVEFILKCLFKTGPRSPAKWELRGLGGNGKITVTGLPGGSERTFTVSKEKLDDIWAESNGETPGNISRLLVVRGGDLALADHHPGGTTKEALAQLLSTEDILGSIQASISPVTAKAEITPEEITGQDKGDVRTYRKCREDVELIDRLLNDAIEARAAGSGDELKARERELAGRIDAQQKAKRHHAFLLKREADGLEQRIRRLPDEDIGKLRRDIDSLNEKQPALARKESDLESMTGNRDNYEWLRHCRDRYGDYVRVTPAAPGPARLIACAAALGAAVVCILTKWPLISLIPLAAAVVAGWLHMRAIRESAVSGVGERRELEKMAVEYRDRFGEPLTNEPQLQQQLDKLGKEVGRAEALENDVRSLREDCAALRDRIAGSFRQLVESEVPPELWTEQAVELKRNRDDLEARRNSAAEQLARLNVGPDQMLEEDPQIAFDADELQKLSSELSDVKERLIRDEQRLVDVKEAIARETGASLSESFATLLGCLTEKQEEALAACREVAARIIAGKVVYDVVGRLREEEDRSIREGLACDAVTATLEAVTGTYNEIGLENGGLRVSSPSSDYDFASLSTGTQEQVMLALRMGFALRISSGDPMFLIFDDAFQHSDWQRREQLVDQAISLVEQGWQIFYLTMDDHLRDLFRTKAATLGTGRFIETTLE